MKKTALVGGFVPELGLRGTRAGGLRSKLCAATIGALVMLVAGAARAEAPNDSVLQAMKDRAVVVEQEDGTKVEGTLAGFDASSVTVLTKAGDPVNIPRAGVKSLRGRPAETPPPAASSGSPQASSEGVQVHIESNNPEVKLYRLAGEATVVAGGAVGYVAAFEMMCTAPCDRPIDGSRGDTFFLSLNGFRLGSTFQVRDPDGDGQLTLGATVHRTPRRGLWVGGFSIAGVGLAAAAAGVVFAVTGLFDERDYLTDRVITDNSAIGWGMVGGGAALLAGGITMAVLGRGSYDLQLPTYGGLKLRHIGLTPPVPFGASGGLPATASMAFTF